MSENIKYPINVYPDWLTSGAFCYVAEHPDLPGCVGYGDTIAQARAALAAARSAYIKRLEKIGRPIPSPSDTPSSEWSHHAHVGITTEDASEEWKRPLVA